MSDRLGQVPGAESPAEALLACPGLLFSEHQLPTVFDLILCLRYPRSLSLLMTYTLGPAMFLVRLPAQTGRLGGAWVREGLVEVWGEIPAEEVGTLAVLLRFVPNPVRIWLTNRESSIQ